MRCLSSLALLVLSLGGCFVPVPSVPGDPPFGATTLDFLVVGSTTRSEVEERMGPPPISREGGRLLIYGAARETGGRILGITIVPMTIPLEEFHFLFLEFDDSGVMLHMELAIAPPNPSTGTCDSHGHCVSNVEWAMEGAVPVWASSGDIRHGERAHVTASLTEEESMREMKASDLGCLVYLISKSEKTDWKEELQAKTPGVVYYAMGDGARFTDSQSLFFALWRLDASKHSLRAMKRNGDLLQLYAFDCEEGGVMPILAETRPTVFGAEPKVRFSILSLDKARRLMATRRMLLTE